MTGKHYRWQARWQVDTAACEARHDSGLVMRFARAGDDAHAWNGEPVNADETLRALLARHGPHNAPQMLARLAREAGEVYTEALRGRH